MSIIDDPTRILLEPRRPSPRFRFGSLDAWRAALFASLGYGAACGGETSLPEHLQCEGDRALQGTLWQCENGIIHRRRATGGESCVGCVSAPPVSSRDECTSDAECPDDALCAQARDLLGTSTGCIGSVAVLSAPYFACQERSDRCGTDDQCNSGFACARDAGLRRCVAFSSSDVCGTPGRPFLVGAEIRRAPLRAGEGWNNATAGAADGLDARQRGALARHYEEAALLEHASIAAFARFTLQLLELGAPADLCSAAQDAMRDETLHARLCFTLASRYAGQSRAPGPLSMAGALAPAALHEVARLCLLEGCVGETLAALDAAEALVSATDPEVRAALERIADDERRHAELAFRFVAWAVEQSPAPGLRRVLAAVLDATVEASRSACSADGSRCGATAAWNDASRDTSNGNAAHDALLEAHGLLSERRRSALRQAALEEVVVPCVKRLLADVGTPRSQPLLYVTG